MDASDRHGIQAIRRFPPVLSRAQSPCAAQPDPQRPPGAARGHSHIPSASIRPIIWRPSRLTGLSSPHRSHLPGLGTRFARGLPGRPRPDPGRAIRPQPLGPGNPQVAETDLPAKLEASRPKLKGQRANIRTSLGAGLKEQPAPLSAPGVHQFAPSHELPPILGENLGSLLAGGQDVRDRSFTPIRMHIAPFCSASSPYPAP